MYNFNTETVIINIFLYKNSIDIFWGIMYNINIGKNFLQLTDKWVNHGGAESNILADRLGSSI